MNTRIKMPMTTKRIYIALACAALVALAYAPGALANHEDGIENDPFTPRFSFSTTTDQAGAYPDLTIEMHKELRNHCVEPEEPSMGNRCTRHYTEETLKQMTVSFPPGAIPDPNAPPTAT